MAAGCYRDIHRQLRDGTGSIVYTSCPRHSKPLSAGPTTTKLKDLVKHVETVDDQN